MSISDDGKLRHECLNERWFLNMIDAQEKIAVWREAYSQERSHSSLQNLSPCEFVEECCWNLQDQRLNTEMAHPLGQDQRASRLHERKN